MARTVDELIEAVRDDIDEANILDVEDSEILKKLNRAQRHAVNKVIPDADELFLTSTTVSLTSGTSEYNLPSDCYGQRLEKIQQIINNRAHRVDRISYRRSENWERSSTSTRVWRWAAKHNKYVLYPTPGPGITLKLWYTRIPEQLVTSQGRITAFDADAANPTVTVNTLGSDLTTTDTGLNNYANVICRNTGRVKGTLQISAINTTTKVVTFYETPTRSTVLGKSVTGDLPTDIAIDDYICTVHGTCVPEVPAAYTDYLTQHATVAIKRSKGENTQEDYADLKSQEDLLEGYFDGRESSTSIARRNPYMIRRR